ncbi:Ran-binding protein 3 [Paragonimus westermani]|uniref:Ran-binding protein 3 n=1 Tax=Paragonimus westermani TaxID=34504 RepID=A0A5J4NBS3_9TREM|nr:Ran-binding protein 3 [Paragonimus westermani]
MSEQANGTSISTAQSSSLFRPSVLTVQSKPVYPTNGVCYSEAPFSGTSLNNSPSTNVSQTSLTQKPPVGTSEEEAVPTGYVFGSDISSRVINTDVSHGASSDLWNFSSDQNSTSSSVFTTLAKAVLSKQSEVSSETLETSANKVTEDQKQAAVHLDQVNVVTGEEDEMPVFRQYCRAYVFDTEKQKWSGLGACHFHLNDISTDQRAAVSGSSPSYRSRVVVRLTSTRKVISNTPVWSTMPVALVNSRNLRIGAISEDGEHIKSYLFAFPSDELATNVFDALNARKQKLADKLPIKLEGECALTGRKRHIDSTTEASAAKLVVTSHPTCSESARSNLPQSSTAPKLANSQTSSLSKSNLFRPSVLNANVPVADTTAHNYLHCTSGVHFRQSALDIVVQRLKDDQKPVASESEYPLATATSKDDKLAAPCSFAVRPEKPLLNTTLGGATNHEFVFGHNVAERVTHSILPGEKQTTNSNTAGESDADETDHVTEPPCELTLTNSACAVAAEMREKSSTVALSELPQAPTLTGEEGECTALKTYCQFYCFDRQKQVWVERGQAYLHLNDIPVSTTSDTSSSTMHIPVGPPTRSRLVARVCKTLKLLANTPVWSGMNVSMADNRSLRLTTICVGVGDDSYPGVEKHVSPDHASTSKPEFCAYLLVMRSPKDATRLYQALVSRMHVLTGRHLENANEEQSDVASTVFSGEPEDALVKGSLSYQTEHRMQPVLSCDNRAASKTVDSN